MTRRWFWGALWTLILTATLQGQSRESVLKAVTETRTWLPAGEPTDYDKSNVDTLVGKRAATLTGYGLNGVTVQDWSGPQGRVRLTLFEMYDASAAYGFFTLERRIDQPGHALLPVGTEGFRVGNRSLFWQSKYVVKLEGGAEAVSALARIVSENIFGQSRKPPVANHLPPDNLIPGSERYLVDATGIGRELNLDGAKLGFEDSVEIATASYRIAGKPAHLVLLLYPTPQIAKKYADQWEAASPADGEFRKRVGPLLALVRGSRYPEAARSILDPVNYESQVIWNEPPPDIALAEMIITIFTFIGIALLFTFIAGISFGGLRIFVKSKYPDRVFDRSQDMEIIQLKLAQGVIRKELRE